MATTLAQARQQLARRLRAFWSGTSDSVAMTTTTMIATAWPLKSDTLSDRRYRDWMLALPIQTAPDQVRLIKTHAPATGTFTVDKAWSSASVPQGIAFELHAHGFHPIIDLHQIINDALRLIYLENETFLTPNSTTGAHRSAFVGATVPWLVEDPGLVYEVGAMLATDDRYVVDPYDDDHAFSWRMATDGITAFLEYPDDTFSSATDLFYVRSKTPAYYKTTGPGTGISTPGAGLGAETDQITVDVNWLTAVALAIAWDRMPAEAEAAAEQRRVQSKRDALLEARVYEARYWEAARARIHARPRLHRKEQNVPSGRLW